MKGLVEEKEGRVREGEGRERKRERETLSICWFTSQILALAGVGPG